MKTIKKITLATILCLTLCLSLFSCGGTVELTKKSYKKYLAVNITYSNLETIDSFDELINMDCQYRVCVATISVYPIVDGYFENVTISCELERERWRATNEIFENAGYKRTPTPEFTLDKNGYGETTIFLYSSVIPKKDVSYNLHPSSESKNIVVTSISGNFTAK